jgi:hypothetical protein
MPDRFLHALMDRLRVPFTGAVNVFSILFAIYGTMAALYVGSAPEGRRVDVANVLLTVLVIALVLWVAVREFYLARKQKYANATHGIYSVSSRFAVLNEYLVDALRRAQTGGALSMKDVEKTFSDSMQGICDETANLFSLLSGTNCRAAVKVPAFDTTGTGEAWAVTVARDTNSAQANRQMDASREKGRTDRIGLNEDFSLLFDEGRPDQGYYCCNNMPAKFASGDLKSTSVEVFRKAARDAGKKDKVHHYPLPYRSTMVWPVRFIGEVTRFHAFLAVDSESRRVFYETWDSKLGGSIAQQANISFRIFNELVHTLSDPKV